MQVLASNNFLEGGMGRMMHRLYSLFFSFFGFYKRHDPRLKRMVLSDSSVDVEGSFGSM